MAEEEQAAAKATAIVQELLPKYKQAAAIATAAMQELRAEEEQAAATATAAKQKLLAEEEQAAAKANAAMQELLAEEEQTAAKAAAKKAKKDRQKAKKQQARQATQDALIDEKAPDQSVEEPKQEHRCAADCKLTLKAYTGGPVAHGDAAVQPCSAAANANSADARSAGSNGTGRAHHSSSQRPAADKQHCSATLQATLGANPFKAAVAQTCAGLPDQSVAAPAVCTDVHGKLTQECVPSASCSVQSNDQHQPHAADSDSLQQLLSCPITQV